MIRSSDTATTDWTVVLTPNPGAAQRLFCFPYAGGHAYMFRPWVARLPAHVEVVGIQLPGRGSRLRERAFSRMSPLIDELAPAIVDRLDRPFAFFGHSLGAVIAFEVCRWLRRHQQRLPSHLIVSGRRAPQLPIVDPPTHDDTDAAFVARLREMNGTPAEVLEDREFLRLVLPMLRADFALTETYHLAAEAPLDCPITALGGQDDDETRGEKLEAWREHTRAAFATHVLPGDHFFLHTQQRELLRILRDVLNPERKADAGD
jgi:medium-chain acyl-[acyl-carrier-protein] hydrolase